MQQIFEPLPGLICTPSTNLTDFADRYTRVHEIMRFTKIVQFCDFERESGKALMVVPRKTKTVWRVMSHSFSDAYSSAS